MSFTEVRAESIGKVYGRQRALSSVNLAIARGEAVALVGPNGAGKSTLLGVLATLIRPTTGTLRFSGQPADAACRGAIGVVAHDTLCYGDLSGRENLRFFARLYGVEDARQRVEALLAEMNLSAAADRLVRSCSRGMQQRLAVARALLHRPRLLLLDEPLSGLDADGQQHLRDRLERERRDGTIQLVVSHDLGSLVGLATRVVVLDRGRLLFDGPAPASEGELRDLYRQHLAAS